MASPISNHCHFQVPLCRGGRRSVSLGGGRSTSVPLLRPPRAAPINGTLSLSASTKPNLNPDLSPIPPLRSLPSSPPPPWLLVQNLDQNLNHFPYCFVTTEGNTLFKPSDDRLPWDDEYFFPDDAEFCGSNSLGWVLMKNPRTDQMFLVNPLSPSDSAVPLPPIYNLVPDFVGGCVTKSAFWFSRLTTVYITFGSESESESESEERESEENSEATKKKSELLHWDTWDLDFWPVFAMSSAPSDPTCTVMVQNDGLLAFWKPGHKCWTQLKEPNTCYGGHNIVYSNAHQCFYVLDADENLRGNANVDGWRWDSQYDRQPRRINHVELSSPRPYPEGDIVCKRYANCCEKLYLGRQYLVESASGGLLLVEMFYLGEKETFFVFKLNLKLRKWEHVNSLGGSSLFLGTDYALCVEVDNHPELEPNCIYLDTGVVFKMDDASIHPNYFTCNHRGQSIWVLPNPNS